MFGWLATRSTMFCHHAPPTLLSRRVRYVASQRWISQLPALGSVLYLHNTAAQIITDTLPAGLLVTQRTLAPLLDVRWVVATSAVTDDGPREWCECIDRFGRPRARLHLLPDTDYLAWEALMSMGTSDRPPPTSLQTMLLRPDSASVIGFDVSELGGLTVLDRRIPPSLSPLGHHVTAHIIRAESVVLHG